MSWSVWIDTGGTFTDCIALGPEREVRRVKVLSSGVLRRRVVRQSAPGGFEVEAEPSLPSGFLAGLEMESQGDPGAPPQEVRAHRVDAAAGTALVELEHGARWHPSDGDVVEFRTGREAPVVGLHLLFGCCFGEVLPPFELRLGTTRGTNALLEGTGARTAAFLTKGFGDLLHIGDQSRPDIFSLSIERAPVLAHPIHEVAARRDRTGNVVEPLERSERARLESLAGRLRADGVEAAAVSLLHAVENEEDEAQIVRDLENAGFDHVSSGVGCSSLRGYLHRTQTAVVDATLSPIMQRYLDRVREGVGKPFQVMSSGGGLVHVDEFRAKDALLSGPAGGVIGCRHAARRAGMLPALAFDMGGTSTDVSRVDAHLEYDSQHEVGGQIVHAAALAIRTVAAGGGSICRIEHEEAMVGPQSAGADPGPACYGAGGPLTLTDVNLLLGRIDPRRFEVPLHFDAAEKACAAQLEQAAGLARNDLLEGFLKIANERMADTIRQVSTRRGFDPRDHTLVAFGGAGGQHACEVAELLGIRRVLVPADCSLLSAVGIGVALPELIVHEQISRSSEDPELAAQLKEGERRARSRLAERERVPSNVGLLSEVVLRLRYVGQDEGLEIPYRPGVDLEAAFGTAYEELFGYRVDRVVEVDWARFEVRQDAVPPELAAAGEAEAQPAAAPERVEAWADGASLRVDRVERAAVPFGEQNALAGPALITEPFSSTWVPPGWRVHQETVASGLVLTQAGEPS